MVFFHRRMSTAPQTEPSGSNVSMWDGNTQEQDTRRERAKPIRVARGKREEAEHGTPVLTTSVVPLFNSLNSTSDTFFFFKEQETTKAKYEFIFLSFKS